MKKNKKILIGVAIALIVAVVIGLSFGISSLTGRNEDIMDTVSEDDMEKIMNDYIKIDFTSVTDVQDEKAPKDGVANVNYTLENTSKQDRWFNLEIAVYDQNGEQIARGFIDQENIPKGEKVTSSFLLDIKPGEKNNVDVANMKVVKAASKINSQSSNDDKDDDETEVTDDTPKEDAVEEKPSEE